MVVLARERQGQGLPGGAAIGAAVEVAVADQVERVGQGGVGAQLEADRAGEGDAGGAAVVRALHRILGPAAAEIDDLRPGGMGDRLLHPGDVATRLLHRGPGRALVGAAVDPPLGTAAVHAARRTAYQVKPAVGGFFDSDFTRRRRSGQVAALLEGDAAVGALPQRGVAGEVSTAGDMAGEQQGSGMPSPRRPRTRSSCGRRRRCAAGSCRRARGYRDRPGRRRDYRRAGSTAASSGGHRRRCAGGRSGRSCRRRQGRW